MDTERYYNILMGYIELTDEDIERGWGFYWHHTRTLLIGPGVDEGEARRRIWVRDAKDTFTL